MHHRGSRPEVKTEERFASFDGTKIAFRKWGEDSGLTPVVFCSGIACDDVYWTLLAPAIARERLVITWDYPFHGDSGPPGDPDEITVQSLAKHAIELMNHIDMSSAVLAGHSMGVQVILETYRREPGRIAGLIALAGPYRQTVGHLYGTNIGPHVLKILEAAGRARPEMIRPLWRLAVDPRIADPLGRAAGLIGQAPVEFLRRYFNHLATLDPITLFAMFRAGHEHSAEDILPAIRVPVLILHGTNDVMTPFPLALEMKERIPDCELVAVEGGAHTLPVEDPDLIESELVRFLKKRIDSS